MTYFIAPHVGRISCGFFTSKSVSVVVQSSILVPSISRWSLSWEGLKSFPYSLVTCSNSVVKFSSLAAN